MQLKGKLDSFHAAQMWLLQRCIACIQLYKGPRQILFPSLLAESMGFFCVLHFNLFNFLEFHQNLYSKIFHRHFLYCLLSRLLI